MERDSESLELSDVSPVDSARFAEDDLEFVSPLVEEDTSGLVSTATTSIKGFVGLPFGGDLWTTVGSGLKPRKNDIECILRALQYGAFKLG